MATLATTFCGVHFRNPFILPSGIYQVHLPLAKKLYENGAGGIVMKSMSLHPRKGHPAPTIAKFSAGFINAVGLANSGIEAATKEIAEVKKAVPIPIIASIFATSVEEFGVMAREVSAAHPDLIEVNISCPNVKHEFGEPFAHDPATAAAATEAVKKNTRIPILVKLSPNVPHVVAVGKAVEAAGADALTAINSVGPGMLIDTKRARPVLSNKSGGVSGPAIFPIALRVVYELFAAVSIPICGTGGVTTADDVIAMTMAGARLIGVGSALYSGGHGVFARLEKEVTDRLATEGVAKLEDLIGKAHQ